MPLFLDSIPGSPSRAISIGPSHHYYLGRAASDITPWVDYFCHGVADSFENVKKRARETAGSDAVEQSPLLRKLDPRQRRALELFRRSDAITSADVARLFEISQRLARNLLIAWVEGGFIIVLDQAKKSRKYALAGEWVRLV